MRTRGNSRLRRTVAACSIGLAAFIAVPALPAGAAGPIVYDQGGGSVPMLNGTRTSAGVHSWLPNSSRVWMVCWADDQWYYGNYWTNRWFLVQAKSGYYGWVNASWVYYQATVPHC